MSVSQVWYVWSEGNLNRWSGLLIEDLLVVYPKKLSSVFPQNSIAVIWAHIILAEWLRWDNFKILPAHIYFIAKLEPKADFPN